MMPMEAVAGKGVGGGGSGETAGWVCGPRCQSPQGELRRLELSGRLPLLGEAQKCVSLCSLRVRQILTELCLNLLPCSLVEGFKRLHFK